MRILVVGSGGREHALTWSIHREASDAHLYAAPGNPGMAALATLLSVPATDLDGLTQAVSDHGIDLTVVGPEVPLAMGLADRLRAEGRLVFGPSAQAARIEASKAYSKALMERAGVPTARARTFTSLAMAQAYVRSHDEPLVVKASGLAAGKGAVVCATREEAERTLHAFMGDHTLGEAGNEVVIEEFMEGEELSLFALTNGEEFVLLPAAQDHKRLGERDTGPNTGGMGACSPVSLATPEVLRRAEEEVFVPVLRQMDREGSRFNGLLYAGLMIDRAGLPRVVEFNCRFGDPETQAILPLLAPGLLDSMLRVARNEPPSRVASLPGTFAVTTVLAARGYPDNPSKGALISLPANLPSNVEVFHAGTQLSPDGKLRVSGGRVLAVTGIGSSFAQAQERSRSAADAVSFDGKVFRRDIGWREASRTARDMSRA